MTRLALLLLPLLGACALAEADAPPEPRLPLRVRVAEVEPVLEAEALVLHGVTQARDEATLSFPLSGPLTRLDVEVGQVVQAGDRLARMDLTPWRERVRALESSRSQVDAALGQVERDIRRLQAVAKTSRGISEQSLDQLESQGAGLRAQGQALGSQLREAKWALGQATLKAPFDGVVTQRFARNGEVLGPGSPVLALRAEGGVEVKLGLTERHLGQVEVGDSAEITFPLSDVPSVSGVVTQVGRAAAPNQLFPVIVDLSGSGDVPPGLTTSVRLKPNAPTGLSVPIAAILAPGGGAPRVTRVRDGAVETLGVSVGAVHGARVEVEGALDEGDVVVVAGHIGLTDGAQVEVAR